VYGLCGGFPQVMADSVSSHHIDYCAEQTRFTGGCARGKSPSLV